MGIRTYNPYTPSRRNMTGLDFAEVTKSTPEKSLVVTGADDKNVVLSARNIPGVKTAFTNTINVYDILKYDKMIVSKDAVATIEEVYA